MKRTWVIGAALAACISPALAVTGDAAVDAATKAKQDFDAAMAGSARGTTGGGGPAGPALLDGCGAANPSGSISLLGVQSAMGPAVTLGPVSRLGPAHPAKKALLEMSAMMGYTNADTPAARSAAQRKSLSDTYETYLYARKLQNAGQLSMPIADLMAWAYSGELEAMARAYAQQQELARQYAPLYAAAEAAGKACPP